MTEQNLQDDQNDETDPAVVALLREIAAVAVDPTEDGVERLLALVDDASTPAMVRIRGSAALLDIGYGPAEEGEPIDEDEP